MAQGARGFFRSEGVARFLGAAPVIDDDTLVVTERFRLIRPGVSDSADRGHKPWYGELVHQAQRLMRPVADLTDEE